ncbi:GntR family transcriptional regulator [Variovorax sp. M-6]|uniref:GntR family transcriptional regulator n=1 Tax=Variovorax sp. M-6 TaxID=3233041 RepID=UPI003F9988FB
MTALSPEAEIHDVLSEMLLSSALPPGLRLGEMELAGAFGVSRERIRKVLQRLGTERLIELVPNRGAFVANPTLSTAREIYDARRMLESGLLLMLANTLSSAQIDELEAHLAQEHEASHQGDRARAVQLSGDFHLKLAEMSGNPFMVRYVQEMVSRTSMLVALFEDAAPTCGLSEHRDIVNALRQRNGPLAAQMGTVHLSLIETRLRIAEHPPAASVDLAALVKARIKSRSRPPKASGRRPSSRTATAPRR